jgi:hypothetical protein
MRARHTATIAFAMLALAACGDPKRGEVRVFWTFAGQNCQQAGVHIIQVDIQGEILNPNQFFCTDPHDNSLRIGADLGTFFFGNYNLTVTGFDADNNITHQASQSFLVNGNVDLDVDLQQEASTFATADLSWDAINSAGGFALGFNGAMTCDEAQVDVVRIFVDPNPDGTGGTSAGDVACDTAGVEGALISPLTAGTHSFAISGFRNTSGGGLLLVYQTTQPPSAPFQIGATTPVDVDAPAVGIAFGAATLAWDFGTASCTGNVTYMLTNPAGVVSTPSPSPCTQPVSLGTVPSGLWRVTATATTTSGAVHADVLFGVPNQVNPPGPTWAIPFSP